jgi:hypothetical protein
MTRNFPYTIHVYHREQDGTNDFSKTSVRGFGGMRVPSTTGARLGRKYDIVFSQEVEASSTGPQTGRGSIGNDGSIGLGLALLGS